MLNRVFRNRIFVIGMVLIPILVTLGYMGYIARVHVKKKGDVPTDAHPIPQAQIMITDFLYTRTLDGKTKWFVKAGQAALGKNEAKTRLWNLSAKIILSPTLTLVISGDRGVIDQLKHQFYVEKVLRPVSARFSTGLVVIASHLDYQDKDDEVLSSGHVIILGPSMIIQGDGLKSVPRSQSFWIDRNVRAVFAG